MAMNNHLSARSIQRIQLVLRFQIQIAFPHATEKLYDTYPIEVRSSWRRVGKRRNSSGDRSDCSIIVTTL